MDWTRNLLILGLAIAGWFLVYQWQQDYGASAAEQANHSYLDQQKSVVQSPGSDQTVGPDDQDLPSFDPNLTPADPSNVLPVEPPNYTQTSLVSVTTDLFEILIDRAGADIVEAGLVEYPVSLDNPEQTFALFQKQPGRKYIAESGLVGVTGKDLDHESHARPIYRVSDTAFELSEGQDVLEVPFVYTNAQGVRFTKTYAFFPDSYEIQVKFRVENTANQPWLGRLYGRLIRNGYEDPTQSSGFGMQTFLGGAYLDEQGSFKKISFSDIDEANSEGRSALNQVIEGGWIALLQHYFLSAWVPEQVQGNSYRMLSRQGESGFWEYILEVAYPVVDVKPGTQQEVAVGLYVGPKIQSKLKEAATGLNLAVDYGYLFFISDALFHLLSFIHDFVGNWGWSIIILTLIVKLLLYPLSARSYRSMAQMRKVQPKLMALRDEYGDDKQKMSQALMKLYQKEKINPLGGCWPMLVQMPIFIALYWALLESVELRQAPFIFWIEDLAVMDPYFVLPLLMGVSMWFQHKMMPAPPDPMQAKIMKLMPVFMTFLFLFFPSGLVLYWLTNNILSILQQRFNTREQDKAVST